MANSTPSPKQKTPLEIPTFHSIMQILRTTSDQKDFQLLAEKLEGELRIRDGDQQYQLAQLNQIGTITILVDKS